MPTYEGTIVYQRTSADALPLFVFAAPAKDILAWAKILETAKIPGAAQRIEHPGHIKSIRSYIRASGLNIVPPSVTLAIETGYQLSNTPTPPPSIPCVLPATLTINDPIDLNESSKPATIIDGQHRLKAITAEAPDMPLVVTLVLGADQLEWALNFIVINNKAKRVSGDLVRGIVAELREVNEEQLRSRLAAVGLTLGDYPSALRVLGDNPESPFYKLIDWDINRYVDGIKRIKPQALEGSLKALISNLEVPESKLDIDDAVMLLMSMWRGVLLTWNRVDILWHDPESKLAGKASMVAVSEYLIERLNYQREEGLNITDPARVQDFCQTTMRNVLTEFWLMAWNKSELDTSAGRYLIRQSMIELRTAVASNHPDPFAKVPLTKMKSEDA